MASRNNIVTSTDQSLVEIASHRQVDSDAAPRAGRRTMLVGNTEQMVD
jgi:hypothetical protein